MYQPVLGTFTSRDPLFEGEPVLFDWSLRLRERFSDWYSYAASDPVNLIDPSGLSAIACPVDKKECTGGCIAGKAAEIKDCNITKLEKQPGSDATCTFVTKKMVCDRLKLLADNANKKHGKGAWEYNYCSKGCGCDKYELPDKPEDIELKEQIIEHTEKTPFGDVHCIFKVSGKVTLSAGALVLVGCKEAKPKN